MRYLKAISALTAALASTLTFAAPTLAQDAAEGEAVFKKCAACHRIGDGAKNSVGPVLNNVVGRAAGTADGYSYSELNKYAGAAGLVWTSDAIVEYLADPNAFLKKYLTGKGQADKATGGTKMTFRLTSEDERKSVVAFLQKSATGK